MIDSILDSTKKMLNIHPADTSFDSDLVMHINSVFSDLLQLGVGPDSGYMIMDKTDEWDAFGVSNNIINSVKVYMFLKIKIIFDPPASSFALDALKGQAEEKGWRLYVMADSEKAAAATGGVILDGGGP